MSHLERRLNPEPMPPDNFEQRRRAGRRSRRRRRLLRALAVGAAALFAAGLMVVALGVNFSWVVNRRAQQARERKALAAIPPPQPLAGSPLVLSEAHVQTNGDDRRIVGTIRNQSARAYRDVELSLLVRGITGVGLGYARARLSLVGPSSAAPFESTILPRDGARFEFYSLTGNPAP